MFFCLLNIFLNSPAFVAEKCNIQKVFTCDLPLNIISLAVSQKNGLTQCLSPSYLFRINIITPNRLPHSIFGHMWVVKQLIIILQEFLLTIYQPMKNDFWKWRRQDGGAGGSQKTLRFILECLAEIKQNAINSEEYCVYKRI